MNLRQYLEEAPAHLKELRELAGVTQEALALALGVGQERISAYERGAGITKLDEIIDGYIEHCCGADVIVVAARKLVKKGQVK